MKVQNIARSTNFSSRPLSSNILKNSNKNNMVKSAKYPPLTQKSAEDDYISSLQKQVYYLELEMKLMKDRELDTKNKIGGYEVLFRDGVPLNENFLALKTKYKNEREAFEKIILDLNNTIDKTTKENEDLKNQIEQTNNNYYKLMEDINNTEKNLTNNIFDSNQKLYTTSNYLTHLNDDKEKLDQDLYRFETENLQNNRIIEKNSLFHEDPTEKNLKRKKETNEKFDEMNKLVEKSKLELDNVAKNFSGIRKLKLAQQENLELAQQVSLLKQKKAGAETKISELENAIKINKRFLFEEEKERDKHIEENNKLNIELDESSQLDDEKLKAKIKEFECKQSIVLKNQVKNAEFKMDLLLAKFKDSEAKARDLLEEKNKLASQLAELEETYKINFDNKENIRHDVVDTKTRIDQSKFFIDDNTDILSELITENDKLREENVELENNIKITAAKIDETIQKIELNSMLKDVDINELKVLSQNNALVNNNINSILSKWDKVHSKLEAIEKKQQEMK